jgi:hypothetical protein
MSLSVILNVTTPSTYYLYGIPNLSVTGNIFSQSITGSTADPDCSVILSALYIR